MAGGTLWTKEEVQFLRENWHSMSDAKLALSIGRSTMAINRKRTALGLIKQRLEWSQQNKKHFIGEKCGKITIIGEKRESQYLRYVGQCEWCGSIKEYQPGQLNKIKSCGCQKHIFRNKYHGPPGQATKKPFYNTYKRGAINRQFEFKLTWEEFFGIAEKNCYYCNAPPRLLNFYTRNPRRLYAVSEECIAHANTYLNGIDRRDNSLGYTVENSVPCCSICNKLKGVFSEEEFIDKVKSIAEFKGKQIC